MTDIPRPRLDLISIGPIEPEAIEPLHERFTVASSELESTAPDAFRWSDHASLINSAIDEAPGWVLLLRAGDRVTASLAVELGRHATDKPVAWAFRIPVSLLYEGGPLYRSSPGSGGEIRFFHGRRCRFLRKGETVELQSRGTVIRLERPIERELYRSREDHRTALETNGAPHSLLRTVMVFLSRLWCDRRRLTLRSLRYHWIEAGWDRGRFSGES